MQGSELTPITCDLCHEVYALNASLDDPCIVGCGAVISDLGYLHHRKESLVVHDYTMFMPNMPPDYVGRIICDWCIVQQLYAGTIVADIPTPPQLLRMDALMEDIRKVRHGHPYDMVFSNMRLLRVHSSSSYVFALFRYNGRIFRCAGGFVSCMSGSAPEDEELLRPTIGKFMREHRFDKLI